MRLTFGLFYEIQKHETIKFRLAILIKQKPHFKR